MERCFRNNTIVCLLNIPLLPCEINHVHAPSCLSSFSSLQVLIPPRRRRTCHDALPPCISCLVRTVKLHDEFQFAGMIFGVDWVVSLALTGHASTFEKYLAS